MLEFFNDISINEEMIFLLLIVKEGIVRRGDGQWRKRSKYNAQESPPQIRKSGSTD